MQKESLETYIDKKIIHIDMSTILLDFNHPVDVNFFKNAIHILEKEHNYKFVYVIRPRGRLIAIFKKEIGDVPYIKASTYRLSLFGKIFSLIEWCIVLLFRLHKKQFDVATSFGSIGGCYIAGVFRKPSVIFDDDFEYKLGFQSYKPFATRIVLPQSLPVKAKNIVKYHGFKELAYLHPNYFKPDVSVLQEYGIKRNRYVFVREVSNSSLNYRDLKMGQLSEVCHYLKNLGLEVILSLEDKSQKKQFEAECKILDEPIRDIYSLLYYALFTISSGDTMARESCLLGTPVIYTGGRYMSVNQELIAKGVFFETIEKNCIHSLINQIIKENLKQKTQGIIQKAIAEEWEDTTQVIIRNIVAVLQGSHRKKAAEA